MLPVFPGVDVELPPPGAVPLLQAVSVASSAVMQIIVIIFFMMSSSNVVEKLCLTVVVVKYKYILAHFSRNCNKKSGYKNDYPPRSRGG